jgi:hypothetical protein
MGQSSAVKELPSLPDGAVLNELPPLPPGAVINDQGAMQGPDAQAEPEEFGAFDRLDGAADGKIAGVEVLKLGLKGVAAMPEFVATMAAAGATEIVAGYFGIANFLLTGSLDSAANRINEFTENNPIKPFSKYGIEFMEELSPPLSKADTDVTDWAEEKTDSPLAAAIAKTAIYGALDAIPITKSLATSAIAARNLARQRTQIIEQAEKLGINLKLSDFSDDILEAAKMIGSNERGEGAVELAAALRRAEKVQRQKKDSAFTRALESDTYIQTGPVRQLSSNLVDELGRRGFDLDADNMALVRRTISDMNSKRLGFGRGQNLAVRYNNLEMVRRRINKRIGSDRQTNAALYAIRDGIDNFLVDEFNKALVQAGQISPPAVGGLGTSAISGDPGGITAWIRARSGNRQYMEWFNEDKVIANLISKEATPETMRKWLMGASAVNANSEAASVIRRMKQILGDDHPSIKAIKADFIYELTEPLLREKPNFSTFANHYDTMVRRNPSIVRELGILDDDIAVIAKYAKVQKDLPPGGAFYEFKDIIKNVSRLSVGSDVAKGAARVGFMTRVLNAFTGVDVVSRKQIIYDLIGVEMGAPIIPKGSAAAATLTAGAAISGLLDEENK